MNPKEQKYRQLLKRIEGLYIECHDIGMEQKEAGSDNPEVPPFILDHYMDDLKKWGHEAATQAATLSLEDE